MVVFKNTFIFISEMEPEQTLTFMQTVLINSWEDLFQRVDLMWKSTNEVDIQ